MKKLEEEDHIRVEKMCEVLEVSRSGYYAFKSGKRSKRIDKDKETIKLVKQIFEQNRKVYGARRIAKKLKKDGHHVSKRKVREIMKEAGLVAIQNRKYKATTNSNHTNEVAPNILAETKVTYANQVWVTDITYIDTEEGWLYLATVMDIYTKEMVGYSMGDRITKELVMIAMKAAIAKEKPEDGLIAHSDRGVQYTSNDYRELLRINNMECSMSKKGNPYDNAAMESFNGTLKIELIYPHGKYKTRAEGRNDIFEYIEAFYNRVRLHSSIGYMSPREFKESLKEVA